MVIANPIYDVVFKRLMEDNRIAKFFIGTLLDQTIESIEVKPQEYTYWDNVDLNDPSMRKALEDTVKERISIRVYRLDFVATIKTEAGEYKKILIEIQKANNPIDLMRFRNYLAEQYKKEDLINNTKVVLPITTIYILGFNLPEVTSPCVKVERNYKDLVNQKIILATSEFIESLTHDSYFVQVERITNRYQTRLDKLLSFFEQTNFVDDNKIIKMYNHDADLEELKIMTDILHFSGTDPVQKKKIEDEQEAWRTINALTGGLMEKSERLYRENIKVKEENFKVKSEMKNAVEQQQQAEHEKQQAIDEVANLKKELQEMKDRINKS